MLDKAVIIEEFENFLNEHGQFNNFADWVSEKGYELTDFGMQDD